MEQTELELWRGRLVSILASAPLDQFMVMIWAIDALQTGRGAAAAKFISFPKEAETSDPFSPSYAHRWRLETILNEGIIHCRSSAPLLLSRAIDCRNFGTFAKINNVLNGLENSEYSAFSSGNMFLTKFIESYNDSSNGKSAFLLIAKCIEPHIFTMAWLRGIFFEPRTGFQSMIFRSFVSH